MISAERRNDIVWLLVRRNDHLPVELRGATPVAAPGFVSGTDDKGKPVRWLSCPDCLTNGRVMPRCETCNGRGEVPDDGPDPYANNETVGYDRTRHDSIVSRDRQIEIMREQTRPARSELELLEEANRRGYAWEELRRAMYRQYDFTALDHALDKLRAHDVDAGHAINAVYVDGWLAEVGQITPLIEQLCERGLTILSALLPDPLDTGLHPAERRIARKRLKRRLQEEAA